MVWFKGSIGGSKKSIKSISIILTLVPGVSMVWIPCSNLVNKVCVDFPNVSIGISLLSSTDCVACTPLSVWLSIYLNRSKVKWCKVGEGCTVELDKALKVSTPVSVVGVSNIDSLNWGKIKK